MQGARGLLTQYGRGFFVLAVLGSSLGVVGAVTANPKTVEKPQVISLAGIHYKDAKTLANNQHFSNATVQNEVLQSVNTDLNDAFNTEAYNRVRAFVAALPSTPAVAGFFHQLRALPRVDYSGGAVLSVTLEIDEYHPTGVVATHFESWLSHDGLVEQPLLETPLAAQLVTVLRLPINSFAGHIDEPIALGLLPNYKVRLYSSGVLAPYITPPYRDISLTQLPALAKKYRTAFYPTYPDQLSSSTLSMLNDDYKRALKRNKPPTDCAKDSCVALTFDDGPEPVMTPAVLDILKRAGVTATFFVQGNQVQRSPGLTKRAAAEGHEIENHTFAHPDLVKLRNPTLIRKQIDDTQTALSAIGVQAKFLRPPYGSVDNNLKMVANMPLILWNVDAQEWRPGTTPASMANALVGQTRPGAIILMHDTKAITSQALPLVIDNLEARDYHFVSVAQLLQIDGAARGEFAAR